MSSGFSGNLAYKRATIIQAITVSLSSLFACITVSHLYFYIMLALTLTILTLLRMKHNSKNF